jgi:hypothetical protein
MVYFLPKDNANKFSRMQRSRVELLIVAVTALIAGFLYYVLFRPHSAFYIHTQLGKIHVLPIIDNLIPDYLWGVSFCSSMVLVGCRFWISCFIIVALGAFFEFWQMLTGNGSAYFLDIVAYALGAVTSAWMVEILVILRNAFFSHKNLSSNSL